VIKNLERRDPLSNVSAGFMLETLRHILAEYEAESGHENPKPYDINDPSWILPGSEELFKG
jgi:hypothetical protein